MQVTLSLIISLKPSKNLNFSDPTSVIGLQPSQRVMSDNNVPEVNSPSYHLRHL